MIAEFLSLRSVVEGEVLKNEDKEAGEEKIDDKADGGEAEVSPSGQSVKAEFLAGEIFLFEEFDGNIDGEEERCDVDSGVDNGEPDWGGDKVATKKEVE